LVIFDGLKLTLWRCQSKNT